MFGLTCNQFAQCYWINESMNQTVTKKTIESVSELLEQTKTLERGQVPLNIGREDSGL
jgi:hypothetical protein